jgi:hypothetical protein
MKGTILLNHSDNVTQVEGEEKSRFLRELLHQMFEDVPDVISKIQEIWADDSPLTVPQKVKMRGFMTTYNIQVIDDCDGRMRIFVEGELIGEWLKCKYKLRRDISQIDPKRQLFLEMEVNCWSVFEPSET